VDRWRFGLNSNGRKYRKTVRRVERKMAKGKEDGGFCGGVEGNIREREKVCWEPWSCSQKVVVIFRERGDVLSLINKKLLIGQEKAFRRLYRKIS
jgi:hypothetical protein